MKIFGLVLLYLKLFDEVFGDCKKLSPLACAFVGIKKSFEDKNQKIMIQNFGKNREIIDNVLEKTNDDYQPAYRFETIHKNQWYKINENGILIFDSLRSLSGFNRKTFVPNNGPKEWQFFVYVDKATVNEVQSVVTEKNFFKALDFSQSEERTEIIHFQYFLIEEENFFVLYTFEWYTQEKCNEHQLVEVNRFDKNTKKWKNNKFKIDKFVNFHGCPLMFTYNPRWPEISGNRGFQYDLLFEISKALNFTLETCTGGTVCWIHRFRPVVMNLEPSTFGNPPFYRNARRHLTDFYYSNVEYYAVPRGATFNSYEKLKFPFDETTWKMIIVTFVVAFMMVFVISRLTRKIKNLVFGSNVSTPSLNIAAHFFGLGQIILPRRNFARFLVMMFIIYCLIVRTAWQSKVIVQKKSLSSPNI
jgi:hypothetical protein